MKKKMTEYEQARFNRGLQDCKDGKPVKFWSDPIYLAGFRKESESRHRKLERALLGTKR